VFRSRRFAIDQHRPPLARPGAAARWQEFMIQTENSNRIAVFIDFDNVEIGVKSTIGGNFDIGLVLEAIKERGEIVTKIAYSDWKRAGDYSRLLTAHAIRMVQRNLTPGGDKNGADITMALDALEMAFTHNHINVFVIVGGDSDFISLVEKLKQYGRKVLVVGGRQFTSATMQRNCHEFIAYENLVGSSGQGGGRGRHHDRTGRQSAGSSTQVTAALPLVLRALKVLSDREVTPQLGLLKSTLLQLDSTFSERNYGAGSFRDFMEKVAQTGAVELKHAGRSMLVEAVEGSAAAAAAAAAANAPVEPVVPVVDGVAVTPAAPVAVVAEGETDNGDERSAGSPPVAATMSMQDGIRAVQHAFAHAANLRWPMYVRQARQFLRGAIDGFDERKYGFASVVDLLRAAGKESVLRIERDRQGAVRVFPGINLMERPRADMTGLPADVELDDDAGNRIEPGNVMAAAPIEETVADLPIVVGEVDPMMADADDEPQPFAPDPVIEEGDADADAGAEDEGPQPGNELTPAGGRRRSASGSRGSRGGSRSTKTAKPRTPSAVRAPRATGARKSTRGRGRGE
jgi:uncharacterized protein (TIGR00288 family)